jgi:hypothetical protein
MFAGRDGRGTSSLFLLCRRVARPVAQRQQDALTLGTARLGNHAFVRVRTGGESGEAVTSTSRSSIRINPPTAQTESFRCHGVNHYEMQFGPSGVRGLSGVGFGA